MRYNKIQNQTITYSVDRRNANVQELDRIKKLFNSIENDERFKDLLICDSDNDEHRIMEKIGIQTKQNKDYLISAEDEIEYIKNCILAKYENNKQRVESQNCIFLGIQKIFVKSSIIDPTDFTWWRCYVVHYRYQI